MQSLESQESQFHGLVWEERLFSSEPRWIVEPDTGAIKQTVQSLRPSSKVEVAFLAQGGFNKIYNVSIDDEAFIMRISFPVDPRYKVMSEVATMDWVRRTTSLPIPRVIIHQPSRDNPIGFEWMLMTKLPGKPFGEIYQSLSFNVKARLVRELAASSVCLFRNQLCGNIYGKSSVVENITSSEQILRPREPVDPKISVLVNESNPDGSSTSMGKSSEPPFNLPDKGSSEGASPDVGRIVSMQFFWDSHIHQHVYRGPFRSSKDWITARLLFNENDCYSALDKHSAGDLDSDDEAEVEDATRTLQIIKNLKSLIPLVFPTDDDGPEPSMIFNHDLSRHRPLTTQYPQERPRYSEPVPESYEPEENGEPYELYFEHL
ncbi:Protein kinase-like domain [Penicillium camemberti]|uniref:Protein kinase-like domain n=1 Tax=Penicillium camemberti (strain FM 013) TaxID=1429867 RepID=A0A0G4PN38_PENC3|nr:Protein kinase-like domain [Penicillium camemberti]